MEILGSYTLLVMHIISWVFQANMHKYYFERCDFNRTNGFTISRTYRFVTVKCFGCYQTTFGFMFAKWQYLGI